jgi:hypothetical protein
MRGHSWPWRICSQCWGSQKGSLGTPWGWCSPNELPPAWAPGYPGTERRGRQGAGLEALRLRGLHFLQWRSSSTLAPGPDFWLYQARACGTWRQETSLRLGLGLGPSSYQIWMSLADSGPKPTLLAPFNRAQLLSNSSTFFAQLFSPAVHKHQWALCSREKGGLLELGPLGSFSSLPLKGWVSRRCPSPPWAPVTSSYFIHS